MRNSSSQQEGQQQQKREMQQSLRRHHDHEHNLQQQQINSCSHDPQPVPQIPVSTCGGSLKKLIARQRSKVCMLEGMVGQLQADVDRVERENAKLRAANADTWRLLAEEEGWPPS